jgi:hypothetical protein
MKLTNHLTIVNSSRMSAFSREDEERMSRDWSEASKPLQGGSFEWKSSPYVWSSSTKGGDVGPHWSTEVGYRVRYGIYASRSLYGSGYYEYEFNPVCLWTTQLERGKRSEERSEVLGGDYETLAEAQRACEEHFQKNFGG